MDAPQLDALLSDDLLLRILDLLEPADLLTSAAPVCRHWASLTRSNELWLPRLPQQARHLAHTCKTGRGGVRLYLIMYQTNLLQNPCFLADLQRTTGSGINAVTAPWQQSGFDRKSWVWEPSDTEGNPHDVHVRLPLQPIHPLGAFASSEHKPDRPRAIAPTRVWCEISQPVDLVRELRNRGFSLPDALALLDAGQPMRFEVAFGQTGWSTGNRLFYECEVIFVLDDGSQPVPLADAATALGPTALACARRKPDMQSHPRWGRVAVQCEAGYPAGARRAVVIIRGRSYPSLFGGMFASPELTLRPPGLGLLTDEPS